LSAAAAGAAASSAAKMVPRYARFALIEASFPA
jgi:hypothetical protein